MHRIRISSTTKNRAHLASHSLCEIYVIIFGSLGLRPNSLGRVIRFLCGLCSKGLVHYHRIVWDMCKGVSISSRVASCKFWQIKINQMKILFLILTFKLAPLRLASWRSLPDRLQFSRSAPAWIMMVIQRKCWGLMMVQRRLRGTPTKTAILRSQFCMLTFLRVATLRLIPAMMLPSSTAPFRFTPSRLARLPAGSCGINDTRSNMKEDFVKVGHF